MIAGVHCASPGGCKCRLQGTEGHGSKGCGWWEMVLMLVFEWEC